MLNKFWNSLLVGGHWKNIKMVVTSEMITIPPRRNSLNAPELATKSPTQKWWHFSSKLKPTNTYGGSTVAVQKLRESKWFNQDEERLFCSVIEGGFIVEMVTNINNDSKSLYGVVSVDHKKSKSVEFIKFWFYFDFEKQNSICYLRSITCSLLTIFN